MGTFFERENASFPQHAQDKHLSVGNIGAENPSQRSSPTCAVLLRLGVEPKGLVVLFIEETNSLTLKLLNTALSDLWAP